MKSELVSSYFEILEVRTHTSDSASLPVMNITTTDTGLCDVYADVPGIFQSWNRAVFQDDVLDSAKDEGSVCFLGRISLGL